MELAKECYFIKNLVLIFLSALLVFINFYTSFTIIPVYVLHQGGSEFFAGVQSAVFLIAGIVLRFYFGPLADKKGRKIPLLMGAFVFSTTSLLLLFIDDYWMFIPVRVYQGIGLATFLSSGSSFVADIVPPEKVGGYIGAYRLVISVALLVGPVSAQAVVNDYGFNTWFIISFICGLAAFVLIAFINSPSRPGGEEISMLRNTISALRNKRLWPAYLGVFLVSTGYGGILNFATVYISAVADLSNPGIYFTCFAAAGIFGNICAGYFSDRLGREAVVWPAVMLLAFGSILLFFIPASPYVMFLSSIFAGIGFSGGISALIAWLVDQAQEKIRATVLSVEESIIDLAMAIGAFFVGVAQGIIGLPLSFMSVGVLILISALGAAGRGFLIKGS